MRIRILKVILWKEILDLWRDRKTLFVTVLLPVISMPMLGLVTLLLYAQQPVNIAIIDLDNSTVYNPLLNITVSSSWLVGNLTSSLRSSGYSVITATSVNYTEFDLAVIIPKGFAENASSLDRQAFVKVVRKANVQPALNAEAIVDSIVAGFSRRLAVEKVSALASLSGLGGVVEASAVLDPVAVGPVIVITPTGAPASPLEQVRPFIARVLILGFVFVVSPASMYVVDSIVGERERKTIEMLLSTPVSIGEIVSGKLIVASVLGLVSSLADAGSLLAYIYLLSLSLGGGFWLLMDWRLLLLHATTAFFTILLTVALATPFVTRTEGVRSASNIATLVNTIGMAVFFSGFMVDYPKLEPGILYPLMLVPYTHSILVIQEYVYGSLTQSLLHLAILVAASITILYAGIKSINPEKILLAKT
ncbi:ABC transporter permease [Thermogladius sp. 4427co]|uniref:ABC transporter permease n=1 Tax=Thermogladius sp. 4427co TaxID=3450718 RepID=UPI003F79DDC3